jgi:hypothetical protein
MEWKTVGMKDWHSVETRVLCLVAPLEGKWAVHWVA